MVGQGTLAHVNIKSPQRVSEYGVDLESFEAEAVSILDPNAVDVDLFVVDEIGKMECFSDKFVDAIRRLLQSDKSLLATVAQRGSGLMDEVKSYPGVELLHLTRETRDEVPQRIAHLLDSPAQKKGVGYGDDLLERRVAQTHGD